MYSLTILEVETIARGRIVSWTWKQDKSPLSRNKRISNTGYDLLISSSRVLARIVQ